MDENRKDDVQRVDSNAHLLQKSQDEVLLADDLSVEEVTPVATDEERIKVEELWSMCCQTSLTQDDCLEALRRFDGDIQKAAAYILEDLDSLEDEDDDHAERERSVVLDKYAEIKRGGVDALNDLCSRVRHRLLFGDNRLPWLDGALSVFALRKALEAHDWILCTLPRPQQQFASCLIRSVSIMLDQELASGVENFAYATAVVDNALEIALMVFIVGLDAQFFEVISSVLIRSKNLWKGSQGSQEFAKRFNRVIHVEALPARIIELLSGPWPGADAVCHSLSLLRLLNVDNRTALQQVKSKLQTLTVVDQSFKSERVFDGVLRELLVAADEGTDSGILISDADADVATTNSEALRKVARQAAVQECFHFWYSFMGVRLFTTSNLEQRLFGLLQIDKLVEVASVLTPESSPRRSSDLSLQPLGLKRLSFLSTDECDLKLEVSAKDFAAWIVESDLFGLIVDENRVHSETLSRARRIVRFMASNVSIGCPDLFSSDCFIRLWRLGVERHESIRSVVLELLVEAFDDSPSTFSHGTDFLIYLRSLPKDQASFVVDFLFCFKRKGGYSSLVVTEERAISCFELLWAALYIVDDDQVDRCYTLFSDIGSTEAGRRYKLAFVSRCFAGIQNPREGEHDASLRSLTVMRRIIDPDTLDRLLLGNASSTLENDNPFHFSSKQLFDVLIADLARQPSDRLRLDFRLETIVHFLKHLSSRKSSQFVVDVQIVFRIAEIVHSQLDSLFFFLERLLKSGSLTDVILSEIFVKLVCPSWRRALAAALDAQDSERTLLVAWTCFRDCFEELGKSAMSLSQEITEARRTGRECLWETALSPSALLSIADSAIKLVIDETDDLSDELPVILSKLRSCALVMADEGVAGLAARRTICRCIAVLTRFADTDKNIDFQNEPVAHGAAVSGNILRLNLTVTNPHTVGALLPTQEGPQSLLTQWGYNLNTNACVRDVVKILRNELRASSLSLMINNVDVTARPLITLEALLPAHHQNVLIGLVVVNSNEDSVLMDSTIVIEKNTGSLPSNSSLSARMVLARSDALFDLLHDLQTSENCPSDVSHEVARLLQSVPSRRSLVRLLSADGDQAFWSSILSTGNHSAKIYRLEVINSLLSPSDPNISETVRASFRARFFSSGGLKAVIEFFAGELLSNVHWSEVSSGGAGFRNAIKILNFCSKDLVNHDDDFKRILATLLQILRGGLDGQPETVAARYKAKMGADGYSNLILNASHTVLYFTYVKETLGNSDLMRNVVLTLVKLVSSYEFPGTREWCSQVLERLSRIQECSDEIWRTLNQLDLENVKCEVYRALGLVWSSKKASDDDRREAAALFNKCAILLRRLATGKINDQDSDVKMQYLIDLLNRLLPDRSAVTPVPPPPPPQTSQTSVSQQHPPSADSRRPSPQGSPSQSFIGHRASFVNIEDVEAPSDLLEWVLADLVFSSLMSSNRNFWTGACQLVTQLCLARPDRPESLKTTLKCRAKLCQILRIKMDATEMLSEWSFEPEHAVRPLESNFVGLVNQGATCYMNSLLQQFFLSPVLREWIESSASAPSCVTAEAIEQHLTDQEELRQRQANDVLNQVRRVFCYLGQSARRHIDPKDLVESCRTLNLSNPVYQQNDARDLCDKLVDRIEIAFKSMGVSQPTKECFGGRVVHQNIKKGCPHPPTERADDFIALELQIKGKRTLENSLRDFCAGETLDGENKVMCDECQQKYPAILRDCLADELPKVLVLHLKRFELDYDTFETVKVNDRLSFPMELDVAPFTREGLKKHEAGEPIAPQMFNLCGVLVHRGVAGGGHYYSIAKDRSMGKWYKFNDDKVQAYDIKGLDDECFGGRMDGQSQVMDGDTNAYMLFYENANADCDVKFGTLQESRRTTDPILNEVVRDNQTLTAQLVLCSAPFNLILMSIVEQSLSSCFQPPFRGNEQVLAEDRIDADDEASNLRHQALNVDKILTDVAMDQCLNWAVRTNNDELFERWVQLLSRLAVEDDQGWIANSLLSRCTARVRELAFKCRLSKIRRPFLRMACICAAAPMIRTTFLAGHLDVLLDVIPETSKSCRLIGDFFQSLKELLEESPEARKLMRGEMGNNSRDTLRHGLARLLQIALGDALCPFTEVRPAADNDTPRGKILLGTDSASVIELDSPESFVSTQNVADQDELAGDGESEYADSMTVSGLSEAPDEDQYTANTNFRETAPRLKPLGWTWTDRISKWNSSSMISQGLGGYLGMPGPSSAVTANATINMGNVHVFENMHDCIGMLFSPVTTLPVYLKPLLVSTSGVVYTEVIKNGFSQNSYREWLLELCQHDLLQEATEVSTMDSAHPDDSFDRRWSASYRIIFDLLDVITNSSHASATTAGSFDIDSDVEMTRYDSAVSVLTDILRLDDAWQNWRIMLAIRPSSAIRSLGSGSGQKGSQILSASQAPDQEPTALRMVSSSSINSPRDVEGLFLACSGPMRRFWGAVAPSASSVSAFKRPAGTNSYGYANQNSSSEAHFRMNQAEMLFCERHARTLASLCTNFPAFFESFKRTIEQQRREVAVGDDDMTRLTYWYAGKSFDELFGGEKGGEKGSDPRRVKRRGADAEATVQALAAVAAVPLAVIGGPTWRSSDPLVTLDSSKQVLGPYHLFDDKSLYANVHAYVIDYPVKRPGMIVEFCARMSARFVSEAEQTLPDDGFVCFVVGKRPGDAAVRMKEDAVGAGNSTLKVFDRVMVRGQELFKRRAEMLNCRKVRKMEEDQSPYKSIAATTRETPEVVGGDDVNTKRPKLDLSSVATTPSTRTGGMGAGNMLFAPVANVSRTSPGGMSTVSTTQGSNKTPVQAVAVRSRTSPVRHNEAYFGVVVKIYTPEGQSKRMVVIRLDSMPQLSSAHSQLIELDEVPDDDQLVLSFPEEVVYQCDEPLSLLDHQFTISRVALVPPFNYAETRVVHTRPIELAVFPGERVGVARRSKLGLSWTNWLDCDRHSLCYYYAGREILTQEGSVLGTLTHESNARPAFHFKMTTLDGNSQMVGL